MIDPRELRIGNLIGLEDAFDSRQYYAVFEIIYDGLGYQIGVENSALLLHETSYRPIPITPEWLERFGFIQYKTFWGGDFMAIEIDEIYRLVYTEGELGEETEDGHAWHSYNMNNPVKSVHQLQNLVFALTGTELTVKEPQTI